MNGSTGAEFEQGIKWSDTTTSYKPHTIQRATQLRAQQYMLFGVPGQVSKIKVRQSYTFKSPPHSDVRLTHRCGQQTNAWPSNKLWSVEFPHVSLFYYYDSMTLFSICVNLLALGPLLWRLLLIENESPGHSMLINRKFTGIGARLGEAQTAFH